MNKPSAPIHLDARHFLMVFFILAIFIIFAFKAINEGWFESREQVDLGGAPALLFFNRSKGCECALIVYRAADQQIGGWSETQRQGIRLIHIDLDRRPDLGAQFEVALAPSVLFVDRMGLVYYRQDEAVSDDAPLDLQKLEEAISEYMHGN